LHFHELSSKESEQIYEDDKVVVYNSKLQKHRIYTNGLKKSRKKGSSIIASTKFEVTVTKIVK
jgi:ribonuclease Z